MYKDARNGQNLKYSGIAVKRITFCHVGYDSVNPVRNLSVVDRTCCVHISSTMKMESVSSSETPTIYRRLNKLVSPKAMFVPNNVTFLRSRCRAE
jgi:hypothetical protein